MKMTEVLDPGVMADRIDVTSTDKTQNTINLVTWLRQKAALRNQEVAGTDQRQMQGSTDSFTSFVNNTSPQH